MDTLIFTIFVASLFAIILARPFTMWWFHIYDLIRLLEEILAELKRLNNQN